MQLYDDNDIRINKTHYFILPVKYAVSQKNTTIYFKWVLSLKVYRDGSCLWCASKIEYEFHGDPSSQLLWELTYSFIFFFPPFSQEILDCWQALKNHGKRKKEYQQVLLCSLPFFCPFLIPTRQQLKWWKRQEEKYSLC